MKLKALVEISVIGLAKAQQLAAVAVGRSMEFKIIPCPEDEYIIEVKAEHAPFIQEQAAKLNAITADAEANQNSLYRWYRDFLVGRVLTPQWREAYDSAEALFSAIRKADAIDPSENWQGRKAAFNAIGGQVTFRDEGCYMVTLEDLEPFVSAEAEAFAATFKGA